MLRRSAILLLGLLAPLAAILVLTFGPRPFFGNPLPAPATAPSSRPATLRIGINPERDLFQQRKSYLALTAYLQSQLRQPVELVTASSYANLLQDIQEQRVDAAFAGSLITILAVDRYHASVLLKSETDRGNGQHLSTYAGVLFVRDDSPIQSVADLQGKRLGGVRTTLGGAIFPLYISAQQPATKPFELAWSGTHEDVIREVAAGNLDAGAVKDTRLDAYEREHNIPVWAQGPALADDAIRKPPPVKFRRLAESSRVPDNALLLRHNLDPALAAALAKTLLALPDSPDGRKVLDTLRITRFLPCDLNEYRPLYAMISALGPRWSSLEIPGPPPQLPTTLPATQKGVTP